MKIRHSILYGILFAVGALGQTGTLSQLGEHLNDTFHGDVYAVNGIIGILSPVVDNVPLVASAMGMEHISFGWYLRHFSWLALTGYLAGMAVFALQNSL